MSDEKQKNIDPKQPDGDMRLNPELKVCPMFDIFSIKEFPTPDLPDMGMRVVDNCAEEHIM